LSGHAADIESIFARALELDAPDERARYLAEACAGRGFVRAEVDRLLGALDVAGTSLDAPAWSATGPWEQCPAVESAGPTVGPYRLLEQIGEGGMGEVFRAEQENPVRRVVALKIIKPGFTGKHVIARFEAERQALALMDHPSIARVLDAGTTTTGRPYFVMELVQGIPITAHCDQNRLNVAERLALFIPVCQAIQHAHQKSNVHRDLKPSNILVTSYGGEPVAKVIDFGVAKAIGQRLTERTLFTEVGQIIGTLRYMSPEQAATGVIDIDTRSDIYALGVVLYELLTGGTPLLQADLRELGYLEILRSIREEETPRPSVRLGSVERIVSIAARRNTEPFRLSRLVRGDLDWIVMKALEKDRSRRYETADGLARDIQRYLDGDPVEARPPSAVYRMRKFARKHRAALVTMVAFASLLCAATVLSVILAMEARTQAKAAELARQSEIQQRHAAVMDRNKAQAAERVAREEEAKAKHSDDSRKSMLEFFQTRVLAATRPRDDLGGLGFNVTIREALEAAEPQISTSFADHPGLEAGIRHTLGETYYFLGLWDRAAAQLERALALHRQTLGPKHEYTLNAMNYLAGAYQRAGRIGESVRLFEEDLALRKEVFGADHRDTLRVRNNLGSAYKDAGRSADAIRIHDDTLKQVESQFGSDDIDALICRHNLAVDYGDSAQTHLAIELLEKNTKLFEQKLGVDHPSTLVSRQSLAGSYLTANRVADATRLSEANLKMMEATLGPDHPHTLGSRHRLADAYLHTGRRAEGIKLHEANLKAQTSKLGPEDLETLNTRFALALVYGEEGRLAESVTIYEGTLKSFESKLWPGSSAHDLVPARPRAGFLRCPTAGRRDQALRAES
jgi:serine/threonine protein kinase/tetratricopeptide (TPR) repeat protein